jgi:putative acetyltransferase
MDINMIIRRSKFEDLAAMARLKRNTIRQVNSRDYSEDVIDAWAERSNVNNFRKHEQLFKRWVAEDEGKIIGICSHNEKGMILGLYVQKKHQKHGIGSKLLEKAEDSLRKMNFKKITLKATITAKSFYEKRGYVSKGKCYLAAADQKVKLWLMEKKIIEEKK